MRRKGFITALAICALITGLAVFAAREAKAQTKSKNDPAKAEPQKKEQPKKEEPPAVGRAKRAQTTVFGLHTLSGVQTLRLSVVNARLNDPPDPVHDGETDPPDPIRTRRVTLAFDVYAQDPPEPGIDGTAGDGSVRNLRLVRRVSRTFELRPGQAAALDFTASTEGETVGAWVLGQPPDPVRAANPPDPIRDSNPPEPIRFAVMTSLEVREGNSTKMVLPGTTRGFNPQPDPPRER
jgi:hypothetical protein